MTPTIAAEAYKWKIDALARILEDSAYRLRKAKIASDLSVARAHIAFIAEGLEETEDEWRENVVKYAADDHRKWCAFHRASYQIQGCQVCRDAVIYNRAHKIEAVPA